jgi:hypothetical protein
MLGAEGVVIILLEAMSASSFRCPAMILQEEPNKHATLFGGLDLPEFLFSIEHCLALEDSLEAECTE